MTSRTLPQIRSLALSPHWLWLVPFALAFAPTVLWLWERWTVSIYLQGHGMFVPLIMAYLIRENLRRDPITEPDGSAWGLVFLATGLALLAVDAAIRTDLLGAIGLILCLPGLSLLLLGTRRTRALAFPLILSGFMLPLPAGAVSSLHLVLRHISAWAANELVVLLGIPVLKDGTTLLLPGAAVQVADACSGVSTLYASLLLGLILAYLSRSTRMRIALIASSIVLAVICNTIRVTGLVLIVHYWGIEPLKTAMHEITGMISFGVVLVILFSLANRERPDPAPA